MPLPITESYVINVYDVVTGIIKMVDRKPVDRTNLGYIRDGYQPPLRKHLGDLNPRDWPLDNGKPKDPWQPTIYLPMWNSKGEALVFAPLAATQISAVKAFIGQFARERVDGMFPVSHGRLS